MDVTPFIPRPVPAASDGEERYCPHCQADLQGSEIPSEHREAYGNKTYFKRLIGMEVQGHYDGVAEWICPDCGARWPRLGIRLTPEMQAAIDGDLARANAVPPDRLSPLADSPADSSA
jgi:hypothetical protein